MKRVRGLREEEEERAKKEEWTTNTRGKERGSRV